MTSSLELPTIYHVIDIRKKRHLMTTLSLDYARDCLQRLGNPADMAIYRNDETVKSILKPDAHFFMFCHSLAEFKHKLSKIEYELIK
jgi:hypothetical protein